MRNHKALDCLKRLLVLLDTDVCISASNCPAMFPDQLVWHLNIGIGAYSQFIVETELYSEKQILDKEKQTGSITSLRLIFLLVLCSLWIPCTDTTFPFVMAGIIPLVPAGLYWKQIAIQDFFSQKRKLYFLLHTVGFTQKKPCDLLAQYMTESCGYQWD